MAKKNRNTAAVTLVQARKSWVIKISGGAVERERDSELGTGLQHAVII